MEHAHPALQGHQEPAIVDLLNEVRRKQALAQSLEGESQSSGLIERENFTVEEQIRVKDAVETRMKDKIIADPVLCW